MWMPDWLYERLPLMYAVLGLGCVGVLGTSFVPLLSAALFLAAAFLAWTRRRSARLQSLRRARPRRPALRTTTRR